MGCNSICKHELLVRIEFVGDVVRYALNSRYVWTLIEDIASSGSLFGYCRSSIGFLESKVSTDFGM